MRLRERSARLLPAGFCLIGVAGAVVAVAARSQAQTPRRVFTVSVATAPAPIVAADDCPAADTCVETGVRSAVVTAVLAAFPGVLSNDLAHAALAGNQLGDTAQAVPRYREAVDVRTSTGVRVRVISRCVDQGSGVRVSQSPTVPATGPATVFAVVPGRTGCSVGVVLRVPAGAVVPWKAAVTLAHRPELQLPD